MNTRVTVGLPDHATYPRTPSLCQRAREAAVERSIGSRLPIAGPPCAVGCPLFVTMPDVAERWLRPGSMGCGAFGSTRTGTVLGNGSPWKVHQSPPRARLAVQRERSRRELTLARDQHHYTRWMPTRSVAVKPVPATLKVQPLSVGEALWTSGEGPAWFSTKPSGSVFRASIV